MTATGEAAPAFAAEEVVETFPALRALGLVRHGFIGRIPGLEVAIEREAALSRLAEVHRRLRGELGLGVMPFATAEQVHGDRVAVIGEPLGADCCAAGADGLVTNQPGVSLGICVADCCAIYLVDPVRRAIGLVHSGKTRTAQPISPRSTEPMRDTLGPALAPPSAWPIGEASGV